MGFQEKKNAERILFKELRDKSSYVDRKNVKINVDLFIDKFFKKSITRNYIGIYWPLRNEVDIRNIRNKYSLALPRCEKNKRLTFCSWDDNQLKNDYEGILAPDSNDNLSFGEISMIFVPCLSVDRDFIRLGYGGGYFDKLRQDKNWRAIPCIGLLTSNCVSKNLLTRGDWDIPLSGFITEKEILF